MAMNAQETEIFRYLIKLYKQHWDKNEYNRDDYDDALEVYLGYRNRNKFPLAYNEVFNRVLPIIYTILSRFMSQIYQTGDIVVVKPRKSMNVESAKRVEGVLNAQLENLNSIDAQGGSYTTMLRWFFNALTFGTGIIKTYWHKEEAIMPKRVLIPVPQQDRQGRVVGYNYIDHIAQEMQLLYDGPYVEVLHNKMFLPDPEYNSIQEMPACFIVYRKSLDHIRKLAEKGIYKNLDELSWSGGGVGNEVRDSNELFVKGLDIAGGMRFEEETDERGVPTIDIIESYCKLIWDDIPYEIGSGIKIKGPQEESIVHIGNYKTILSAQKNKTKIRPLFKIGAYMHPELFWDVGLVKLTMGLQNQINTLGNLRMQNAMVQVNQMLKVRADADIDPESLVWKPFGLIPVEEMTDVEPLVIPDTAQSIFLEQERFYNDTIQDLTGMYSYNMGQTPVRQEKVGVVHSLQTMGEARAKLMLMSMDYIGIRPWLNYLMLLNTFYLKDGYEFRVNDGTGERFDKIFAGDIHPYYDFSAKYTAMEPALGKNARAQILVNMAGLWKDNPWINQYQWNKALMELMDVREAPYMLKSPEQMQQEIMQQQQQAMLAEMQAQRNITEQQLIISEKDYKEEYDINEQEFAHDIVIESMKLEGKANAKSNK